MDEGRGILHYVDQRNPAKDWHLKLPKQIRDFQPIGQGRVLIAQSFGYSVYELATRTLVEDVKVSGLSGCLSARRRMDGTTVLGAGQKVIELDRTNAVRRTMTFANIKMLRMIRPTADGTVLLGEETGVTEAAFDADAPNGGRVVRHIPLPRGKYVFMALKKSDGGYLFSGGYARTLFDLGPDGAIRREYALKDPPPTGAGPFFFAGFQVLKNGNFVVCNWTGHGPADSAKGWQILEFAPDRSLVWHWHDPTTAGTLVNIAVLDDLDENTFFDDSTGILTDGLKNGRPPR
jgi:hypothetical protein